MKILIDLQGCQTASRHRGIGRYSLALATAIVRNRGGHRVVLLANGAFGDGLAALRAQFVPEIADEDFVVFDVDLPVAEIDPANAWRARLAEVSREHLIAELGPDVVLLTSLFEGFIDDAVTSVGRAGRKPLTAVTLYDLIPYLRPDPNWPSDYLPFYNRKIASLKQVDLLLSISDYSRLEATGAIPELGPRIVNMSSACDGKFFPAEVDSTRREELLGRYGIRGPFIMSAGNIETRKNFEQILLAFGMLPEAVKAGRQIVLVGDGTDTITLNRLREIAASQDLDESEFIVTGHAPDQDLLDLYRLCELFVFPSRHEGFGLPPLEAMSCGAAVIGSNATSVPEVIGRTDAQFDPDSVEDLRNLMHKALTDEAFLISLKERGLRRSAEFSWDRTAQTAIRAMSQVVQQRSPPAVESSRVEAGRPRLAVVSPLPPEQTGIADYMAELLPELGKRYDVTVISDQAEVASGPGGESFRVKPLEWFEENAASFRRVVYQMGNSPFHVHMLDMMVRHPGVVVLHDFFLSSLTSWMELSGYEPDAFKRTLLYSHGYRALYDLDQEGVEVAKFKWPCSFKVVSSALGLLLHSNYSRELVSRYYGPQFAEKATVTRHHRLLPGKVDRSGARARLGISDDCFVVCAFGFMDATKLNHRLLEAWAASSLAGDAQCHLVFVGGEGPPDYHERVQGMIASVDEGAWIKITGFAARETFEDYLTAADAAVQLRAMSRGETSGTVLDCLAYGVPVVLNAHGSMREYPEDVLIKLEDEFDTRDLAAALQRLRSDVPFRQELSKRGVEHIRSKHTAEQTVEAYAEVIERVAASKDCQLASDAISAFWAMTPPMDRRERVVLAQKLIPLVMPERRPVIYVDVSATARNDIKTGIERVTRALLHEIIIAPPAGYDVIPVYLVEEQGRWRVRRANRYLAQLPGFSLVPTEDELVIPDQGDILMSLDVFADGVVNADKQGLYDYWRNAGARIGFMVYDILPITHPEFFPPWAPAIHESWVRAISGASDFLICISEHVKSEVIKWLEASGYAFNTRPRVEASPLGADLAASFPSVGLPEDAGRILDALAARPTFLMVGTVEPRKGHLLALRAFESLWRSGADANLVIVGNEGWKQLPDQDRRSIPDIVKAIRGSLELGERLFWLEGISDEYLEKIYAASDCLIAASEDEGFGLPLIEARRHGLPVLARDIQIFREVGGNEVEYFAGDPSGHGLVQAVTRWLERGTAVQRGGLASDASWVTWSESAKFLTELIVRMKRRSDISA